MPNTKATSLGFIPDWPAPAGVKAFVTTRQGGYSQVPWESNNLALHVGDDPGIVRRNRLQLMDALQLSNEPQWLRQVHGTDIVEVGTDVVASEADGSITSQTEIACVVLTADCLPIILSDNQGHQVAAIHAGWRGLAAGIIAQGVKRFTTSADDLLAYLGPGICQQCYEVDTVVCDALIKTLSSTRMGEDIRRQVPNKSGHYLVSLAAVAKAQLRQLGVVHVFGGEICNSCDARFFSYRRDRSIGSQASETSEAKQLHQETGRFATLIWRD